MYEWELRLSDLTSGEYSALLALFDSVEGCLLSFTFLDPFSNLLLWSEDPTDSAWYKEPLIQLSPGRPDHMGTARATRLLNSGIASQRIEQTLSTPSWYQYSLSVWLRTETNAKVTLAVASTEDTATTVHEVGSMWRRCALSSRLNGTAETLTVGISLAGGESVDAFGFQLDAQPAPSNYKRSTTRTGIHPNARFRDDILDAVTTDLSCHSVKLTIVSSA